MSALPPIESDPETGRPDGRPGGFDPPSVPRRGATGAAEAAKHDTVAAIGRRVRVLVVEDRPVARKLIEDEIRQEGGIYVAGAARNGEEALRMVKELDPDVVLMDVVMPGKDGLQTLVEIRAFSEVPVVLLTGASVAPEALEHVARRRGADAFFRKPSGNISLDLHQIRGALMGKLQELGIRHAVERTVGGRPDDDFDRRDDRVPNA